MCCDLCQVDPGFKVDLYVVKDLRTMTAIWMGLMTVRAGVQAGRVKLTGALELEMLDPNSARTEPAWQGETARSGIAAWLNVNHQEAHLAVAPGGRWLHVLPSLWGRTRRQQR